MIGFLFWFFVLMIVYVYAGYPILLVVLAKFRKKTAYPSDYTPAVTLLIAAYNEEKCIGQKLDNSLGLDYPVGQMQILVAADGSDDGTVEIVRRYADRGAELSYQPLREGKMAAINRAMAAARGDIVVFSDANNTYEAHTIRAMAAPFAMAEVGAVSGAKHILKEEGALGSSEGLYWKYEAFIKKQETRLGSCSGVSGEAFAIRKDLFEPAPRGIINDDFYLAMQVLRKGYRVVYAPDARSFERVSLTAQDEITRRTRINAGRYQALHLWRKILPVHRPMLMWQVISHKFLRLLVPFALLGALATNMLAILLPAQASGAALIRLATPFNWILFILQCVFYAAACVGSSLSGSGAIGKLFYLPTFLVNSNVAALQGLLHYAGGKEKGLWKKVRRAGEGDDNG